MLEGLSNRRGFVDDGGIKWIMVKLGSVFGKIDFKL